MYSSYSLSRTVFLISRTVFLISKFGSGSFFVRIAKIGLIWAGFWGFGSGSPVLGVTGRFANFNSPTIGLKRNDFIFSGPYSSFFCSNSFGSLKLVWATMFILGLTIAWPIAV